jgi:hypothetical protein
VIRSDPHIPISKGNGKPHMSDDQITQRDLVVEGRLARLETTVDEIKTVITQARPQLAVMSMLGSGIGSIVVALAVWFLTKGK